MLGPCFRRETLEDAVLRAHLDRARHEIQVLVREPIVAWRAADCMSEEEIRRGRQITAGHGLYDAARDSVRLNRDMSAEMIYLNFVHEHLHRVFPRSTEEAVRILTALIDCRVRRSVQGESETCKVLEELTEPWRPYR